MDAARQAAARQDRDADAGRQLRRHDRVAHRRLRRRERPRAAVDARRAARPTIRAAIADLQAGGSTNGAPASSSPTTSPPRTFIKDGINRVILATDGDFNVGVTSQGELMRLIEEKRETRRLPHGARLRHGQPQGLDDGEARATRGTATTPTSTRCTRRAACSSSEAGATLVTVAKDVKIQVEFNPAKVARVSADRLREPDAAATRTSTTTRRTPARSAPATP